jgi:hypothetical protein
MPVPYEDQVPRLLAFREAHPEVEIRDPVSSRRGVWSAHRDGQVLAVKYELADLLDRLETELS